MGYLAGKNIPTVPVYDGHQIDESGSQADISDVSSPDIVGTIDGQPL